MLIYQRQLVVHDLFALRHAEAKLLSCRVPKIKFQKMPQKAPSPSLAASSGAAAPSPPPLPDVGSKATSDPGATQDAGPGLAIGLALGGCLLAAVLAAAVFVWHRKRRMQPPTGSSTRAPQQVEVTVAQPDSQKV